jgi:lipopolysaccharide export system protein LptA
MLKPFFIISIAILFFTSLNAFSEESTQRKIKGPITVTSETLTDDNKSHTAFFEKNVIARTTDMTLYADTMLVYYKEGSGDVTKIDASGNVKLFKNGRVITSDKATYYADEDKVIFTGEPRAVDGENVVTGSIITYYISDDRSYVEKSKVFLKNKKEP